MYLTAGRRVGARWPTGSRARNALVTNKQTTYFDHYDFDPTDAVGSHLRFFTAMWNFAVGSQELVRQHREYVAQLVERAQDPNDGMVWLQLLGVASRSGKRQRNMELSRRRVITVAGHLLALGLEPERILGMDQLGEDGWAAAGVADGTEDYRHRAVYVWCWLQDPRQHDHTFPFRLLARAGVRTAVRPSR